MSEQQIVDCAVGKRYHNKGCHGGWYQFAWKYLKENGKKKVLKIVNTALHALFGLKIFVRTYFRKRANSFYEKL